MARKHAHNDTLLPYIESTISLFWVFPREFVACCAAVPSTIASALTSLRFSGPRGSRSARSGSSPPSVPRDPWTMRKNILTFENKTHSYHGNIFNLRLACYLRWRWELDSGSGHFVSSARWSGSRPPPSRRTACPGGRWECQQGASRGWPRAPWTHRPGSVDQCRAWSWGYGWR